MKWKTLFAAACAAALAATPALAQDSTGGGIAPTIPGRAISVNFTDEANKIPEGTVYGIDQAQVAGWNNVTPVQLDGGGYAATVDKGTVEVIGSDGASAAKLAFVANNVWSYSQSSVSTDGVDSLLCYYLGDNTNTNAPTGQVITVSEIPFETYDVIVYLSTDTASTSFLPVTVNSNKYVGTAAGAEEVLSDTATWGTSQPTTSSLGGNVLCVEGVTGASLTIRGSVQKDVDGALCRCNIAGFQIVERLPLTINVNIEGVGNGNNPFPDSLVGDTSAFSGLVPVVNANWNEVETPTGDGVTTEIANAKDSTGEKTTARINLAVGGGWTLKAKSTEVQNAREARIGKMGLGYADACKTDRTPEITLANVPYTEYSVILYYATDNENKKWAPAKVTSGDTMTYYYYGEDDTLKNDGSSTSTWGSSSDCASSADNTATLGKDIMRIDGLSGDLSIDLDTTSADTFGGLCGFQIVCTGEVFDPTLDGVMSLNFATGGSGNSAVASSTVSDKEGYYGLAQVPADTWVDLTGAVDTDTQRNVTKLHGNPTVEDWSAATVTWKAKNTWSYDSAAAEAAEPFLPTYLDDGEGNGADGVAVSVSSVPFEAYDAIVYFSNDAGRKYRPVQINNNYYTYNDAYGAIVVGGVADATQQEDPNAFGEVGQQATAKLGVNALRVNGLKGDFSLQGATVTVEDGIASSTYDRCGIAAVQLVARQLITVSDQADWATLTDGLDLSQPLLVVVQDGASITGNVTLPADTILDFSDYTFGETAPFTDTLTMNGGTIRLPGGFESGKIATVFSGNNFHCFIAGKPVWLSKNPGDGALSVSYMWTGLAGDTRWSNPGNWSSLVVPGENADVLFMPAASQPETVTLDTAATVASVTITGPASGTAASLAIQAQEGASLTVSGRMLTTGNVTVTQSANITVRGATKTGVFYPGTLYETTQPVQAGFHIHQGKWQILSGTLDMPTDGGANTGEAGISGGGTLIVGGGDASGATLAVWQIRPIMYGQVFTSANGTLRVAAGGTLTATEAVTLAVSYGQPYTVDLAGGTIETPTLATFAGVTVSDDSSLRAPNGRTLNVTLPRGSSGDALTGTDGVTLSGTVTIPSELTDYTGTLTVSAGSALTLSANARPSLVLEDNASLTVTPTPNEIANTSIVFPTSMTTKPENVTYTVSGVTKAITVTVNDNEDTLTLSWEADYPTLSTTSNWSTTANWTNLPEETTPTYPTSGSAILDGTQEAITVTLNTDLSQMTSIFVKGDVTLVTKGTQSTTIPACVKLTTGATLTIDANFSGEWELPAGTTLQVTKGFTSFANLKLEGAVVILEGAFGTEIDASSVQFNGGLTIAASNLTLKSVYNVGTTLALNGENIALTGGTRFFTDNDTKVVNTGTDNVITGMTGLNGSLAVEGGTLALTLGASPTNTFSGATIAGGATLTLAGPSGWFPATGAGTLVLEGDYRPLFAAVGVATTTPAIITATATADEQSAGTITFANYQSAVSFPEGFEAKIKPNGAAAPWVTVAKAGGNTLQILNVPAPNGLTGLDDAVALTLRQAAAKAGITNGDYTVRLTTGGQTAAASAATLNDVLGCFTSLTATADAEKTTLTYAYDFGISGVRRTKTGWEVVVKVTGAGGTPAGFAADNVYTVKDATVKSLDVSKAEQGEVVLSVTGELKEVSVSVARQTTEP